MKLSRIAVALGALVGLFAGPDIVNWYRDTFL